MVGAADVVAGDDDVTVEPLALFAMAPDADVIERKRRANVEKVRRWEAANPERVRARLREKSRRAREVDPEGEREKAREVLRRWRLANPTAASRIQDRRRARRRGNGVFVVTERDRRRILSSPCLACGSLDRVSVDHLIPIARGGTDGVGNYAPLCLPCNTSKGALTYAEWRYSDRPRARAVFGRR
jgi:5-methylcytosine-specific restriction endonuclease McrA